MQHNNLLNKRILVLCLLLIGALAMLLTHVGSAFASRLRETRIYFGGQFQAFSGKPLNNVGYFTYSIKEDDWKINFMSGGTDGPVKVVKLDPMGNVYIGGSFTTVGSLKTGPIAAYNVYQEKWVPIGLNNSQFSQGSTVNAISFLCKSSVKVVEGLAPCDVYVGGNFSVSLNETSVKNLMSYSFADSKWKEFNLLPLSPDIQIQIDLLLKAPVKSISVSRETLERPVTWLDIICSTGWVRFLSDDQISWYFTLNGGILNFSDNYIETYATSNRTMILSTSHINLFEGNTKETVISVPKYNKIRGYSNTIYLAGENLPISCSLQWNCSENYSDEKPPIGPILAMDLANENSDRPGFIVVGGNSFLWFYDPKLGWTNLGFLIYYRNPGTTLDVVIDASVCFENMFGDECQNKVKLSSTIYYFPSKLAVSDTLEINDGKEYYTLWKYGNQIFNSSSLTIYNPTEALNCEGCNSFYFSFQVYNSDGNQVYEKTVQFISSGEPIYPEITYVGGLNFKVIIHSLINDDSNICSVGLVTEKNSTSLKELLENKNTINYYTHSVSCDEESIIKVPYLGRVPYTLLRLTLQNAKYEYNNVKDHIVYFPTFFANIANFANGTKVIVKTNTLSFSSTINSNIPELRCRADLIVENSSIKMYESNCTNVMNFTYELPSYVNNARVVITLSNDEYYYEETENFDIEVNSCNLICQNGGSCKKSANGLAFCECNGNFVGDYCESCKEGFIKQAGKCVCNSGYQQIGGTCVKGNSDSNNTTCFGINSNDSFVCNGKGNCTSFNYCNCYNGFTGIDCSIPICFGQSENSCNGNGNCIAPDTCKCNDKFGGMTCTIPKCNGLLETEGACSFHGSCNEISNLCECKGNFAGLKCSVCKEGFTGTKCDIPICNGISGIDYNVCGGNGKCKAVDTCQCNENYYGPNCASFKCNGIEKTDSNVCSSNGYCNSVDTCSCNSNYDPSSFCSKCLPSFNGSDCSTKTCTSEKTCNSHGICNEKLECSCYGNFGGKYCEKCLNGWVGLNCDISCNSKTTCSGKGTCSSNGTCICSSTSYGDHCENCKTGWFGENCDYSIDYSSFEFNENGDVITGTVYSGYKKNIDCSSLLTNAVILGKNPTCLLDGDKNLLTIYLGSSATIVIQDQLNMRVSIDSQSTRNATVFGTFYMRTYPTAFLTSEKSVIGCGNMFLDASSSTSLDRRRLIFTFSATLAPNDKSLSTLRTLISQVSSSTVKFPVDGLSSGTYSVQVSVQSSFSGRISYATYSFTVTDSSPPNLNIKNGLSSVAIIGNSFAITPIVSFSSCYKGSPAISSLNFNYTQLSGPTLQIKQMNELLVFSSDFTNIREEGKYYFNLKAHQIGYPEASINFEINAVALPLKVSFNIRDMSISMEDNIKFTILKQDPSNTGDIGEQVVLSCINLDTSQDCGVINIDQSTLTFNERYTPGNYLFTATYNKGLRSSSSKIRITVTNQSKSLFLRVYIASSSADLTAVDPSSNLILQAQSLDSLSSQRTYQWSATFDISTIESNAKYLSIPTSSLVPGASYTVYVKIVDQAKVGESSISFIVNSPPTLGALDINPSSGAALVDEFQISCGNGWSDSQLPLSFKFLLRQQGEPFWNILKEKSETRSFSTILPSGSLEIKAIVYDSQGAFTETIQNIQVSTPNMDISSAVKSLNSLSASSVTPSSASTVLNVIQSLKPQTEEEKQNLIEIGSKIALAFFDQIDKEEKSTQQTVSSTSSSISVISTISTCIETLPESTIGVTISKFKSTIDGANSKLILPSEDIESSFSSALTIQSHVLKNKARSISLFSEDQVKTLDQVKESLINLKLKNLVPDMPAAKTFGSDFYSYVRLMSVSSLGGLNDTINSVSSFSLSQSFDSLTEVSKMETVKLYMKVQNWENSITKLFTFKVLADDDSEIVVKSDSGKIAQLVIEPNQGAQTADYYDCKSLQNGELLTTDNCQIVSSFANVFTVQISSTGSYVIQARKDYQVVVSTTMDMLKYVALVTLIVPVLLFTLIVVLVVACCCVRRKKKQMVLGTV